MTHDNCGSDGRTRMAPQQLEDIQFAPSSAMGPLKSRALPWGVRPASAVIGPRRQTAKQIFSASPTNGPIKERFKIHHKENTKNDGAFCVSSCPSCLCGELVRP